MVKHESWRSCSAQGDDLRAVECGIYHLQLCGAGIAYSRLEGDIHVALTTCFGQVTGAIASEFGNRTGSCRSGRCHAKPAMQYRCSLG